MWEQALSLILANGAWAVLFCVLLVFELKDSRSREKKYTATITALSSGLKHLDDVMEVCEDGEKMLEQGLEELNAKADANLSVSGEVKEAVTKLSVAAVK